MTNPICNMLGIRYPILLGGMLFVGRAPLVAAVSGAGGIGVLGAGHMRPEELRTEIDAIRRLTSRPFGINIPLRHPKSAELIHAATASGVRLVTTSAGSPQLHTGNLKKHGTRVFHVVATVRQAVKAQAAGVDAIVAEGCESGGFLGRERVTTLALVPQVVDAVQVPVVAAGGIADGRGMAAAFALGAVGIQMGTRFLAAEECRIPAEYRKALVLAGDTDTTVTDSASGAGRRGLKQELLKAAAQALAAEADRRVDDGEGDPPVRGRAAGQSAGLVREILPVREIVRRILDQAAAVARDLPAEFDWAPSATQPFLDGH